MPPRPRYRCRSCGFNFPAARPVTQEPNGALLLNHLSQQHPNQERPCLERMVVEAYEGIGEETRG
jgi:hypothetical protein